MRISLWRRLWLLTGMALRHSSTRRARFVAGTDRLSIADTNNHAIRIPDVQSGEVITLVVRDIERLRTALIADGWVPTIMPPIAVAPGEGRTALDIVLPPGYKVNDLAPSSVRWSIDGGITLPADADRSLAGIRFPLELSATDRKSVV